ncbi:arsenate-mycothiol transferase ArsC [Xanthobacter sp. TB0136]|uniref:arsenate-mycothiol transferase ArsC n=1 Tax=Xanthobacter sp. TB0136 TaxID=3459177 RepID=UPI004039DDB2
MIRKTSILFLCRDNAGISLMAEALAIHLHNRLHKHVRAFSAAVGPTAPVDEAALACLQEAGVPTDGLSSKPVELFALSGAPRVDVVVPLQADVHHAVGALPWLHLLPLRARIFEDIGRRGDAHARRVAYRDLLPALRQVVLDIMEMEAPGMVRSAA